VSQITGPSSNSACEKIEGINCTLDEHSALRGWDLTSMIDYLGQIDELERWTDSERVTPIAENDVPTLK